MPFLTHALTSTTVDARTWMSNYIPPFYGGVITYPCFNQAQFIYSLQGDPVVNFDILFGSRHNVTMPTH